MREFESTYQAHKVGSLQKVRDWIECENGRQSALKAIRSIATHCIVDVCWSGRVMVPLLTMSMQVSLGNLTEAQTHQRGLLTLVEHLGLNSRAPTSFQEELMNRYILM